jgi:hypothetical protein
MQIIEKIRPISTLIDLNTNSDFFHCNFNYFNTYSRIIFLIRQPLHELKKILGEIIALVKREISAKYKEYVLDSGYLSKNSWPVLTYFELTLTSHHAAIYHP